VGATSQTPANLVIGAGDVKVDSVDKGVTADDNVFKIDETIFEPDNLNGVPGMLVGTQYKTKGSAMLTTKLPEVSADSIELQWPGSRSTPDGDDVIFDWDGTRRLPTSAFHDYELIVPGLNGRVFGFEVDNAINQAGIEFAGKDEGMMAPSIEAHSKWDPTALDESPYRIRVTTPGSGS
jgi:hypothetical protein